MIRGKVLKLVLDEIRRKEAEKTVLSQKLPQKTSTKKKKTIFFRNNLFWKKC